MAQKLRRILFFLRLAFCLVGLLDDPYLFVIPNLDLPADTQGNEIALNPRPSLESFYNEIERADSLGARNLQLVEDLERIQGMERALENEGDPVRRRELSARIDWEAGELERKRALCQTRDAVRDRQIAEWRGRFNEELAREGEESARRTFLNWCLRVLIHAQEHQPPQN